MARRERKRQLDAESLYWQLLLSGTGTVGVQGGGYRPQDRVPVAGGERRDPAGAAGRGGPVGPVPVC